VATEGKVNILDACAMLREVSRPSALPIVQFIQPVLSKPFQVYTPVGAKSEITQSTAVRGNAPGFTTNSAHEPVAEGRPIPAGRGTFF
jgi:hypothetical protein